jgi:hypothetical protein
MSVRGEDLKRTSKWYAYTLFWLPWINYWTRLWIESNKYNFVKEWGALKSWNLSEFGIGNSWYQKLLLRKTTFGWANIIDLSGSLFIWSRADSTWQWNWVINYIRMYVKK